MEQFFSRRKPLNRSLAQLSDEELDRHLSISRYDDFELTEAVRPAYNCEIVPQRGYQRGVYHLGSRSRRLRMMVISETKHNIIPLWEDLLKIFRATEELYGALHSTHSTTSGYTQHIVEDIDYPVFLSHLYEFENMLLNDGCFGVSLVGYDHRDRPAEVRLDEHKLIYTYGASLRFREVLDKHDVPYKPAMRFLTEAEHTHTHSTSDEFREQFRQLKVLVGADDEEDWEV